MPKIYEYFGLIFFFWSNEHEPIHVHVTKNGRGMIYEIILEKGELADIRRKNDKKHPPLTDKEDSDAYAFVEKFALNIVKKWVNYFVYNKPIRATKITKKI